MKERVSLADKMSLCKVTEPKYKSELPCLIFENLSVAETKNFGEDRDDYIRLDEGSTFRPNCVPAGCIL